jgi:hypothetical protein
MSAFDRKTWSMSREGTEALLPIVGPRIPLSLKTRQIFGVSVACVKLSQMLSATYFGG